MLVDYHIHTFRCGHAIGTVGEYITAARKKGLTEFGFSDHLPLYWLSEELRDRELAMTQAELALYIDEVQKAQQLNPDLSIKLGIEADYIPGHEGELAQLLAAIPLDYVIGSVHFLNDWAFDDPAQLDKYKDFNIDDLYYNYFDHVRRAAETGLFDIIGHPDLIKKFGFRASMPLEGLYLDTVLALKKNDLCVDVNAAGWRYPCGELYPAPEFLALCHEYGVPVTLGSDAHKPELVGEGLERAVEILKSIGFRQVAVFEKRRRSLVDL
ncbi:histidinol-phosphatase HisJ family protein [Desulforamulus aquiferis]|uniref:Histidinol-phosphatase n=1 Tax=Desulforamulus aquiferis TaxID=1397668 RepID=A0AAW7ZFC2_9FIRM|nr:histidinol-phosphatase HisJ family protein [Desulforamulus aquiferis]